MRRIWAVLFCYTHALLTQFLKLGVSLEEYCLLIFTKTVFVCVLYLPMHLILVILLTPFCTFMMNFVRQLLIFVISFLFLVTSTRSSTTVGHAVTVS